MTTTVASWPSSRTWRAEPAVFSRTRVPQGPSFSDPRDVRVADQRTLGPRPATPGRGLEGVQHNGGHRRHRHDQNRIPCAAATPAPQRRRYQHHVPDSQHQRPCSSLRTTILWPSPTSTRAHRLHSNCANNCWSASLPSESSSTTDAVASFVRRACHRVRESLSASAQACVVRAGPGAD